MSVLSMDARSRAALKKAGAIIEPSPGGLFDLTPPEGWSAMSVASGGVEILDEKGRVRA